MNVRNSQQRPVIETHGDNRLILVESSGKAGVLVAVRRTSLQLDIIYVLLTV